MKLFRHSKRDANNEVDSLDRLVGVPRRAGRKRIEDGQFINLTPQRTSAGRKVGDFNQPSGYYPSQPAVSSRLEGMGSAEQPSMINKTIPTEISKKHEPERKRSKKPWKKRAKYTLLTTGVVLLAIAGFLVAKGYINLEKVFGGNKGDIQAILRPSQLTGEGNGRINVLVLGIGGVGHDGPDLTDTMLLVSIDPVNHKADLLSIPRDWWVNPSGYFPMKVNALYENAKWKALGYQSDNNANQQADNTAFSTVDSQVSNMIGIPIKYNVLLDFQAFQQVVDTLGGITVNVPSTLYDPTIAWENNNNPIIARQGVDTFNGSQALLYVRSRETTSDFARTERQRAVLLAIKSKALSTGTVSNPVKLSQLADEFGNDVHTNVSLNGAETLYNLFSGIDNSQIQSIGLADPPNNYVTTEAIDGQSTVVPTAGLYNYGAIQSYVRNTLRDGYLAKENAQVAVLNGTSDAALASQQAAVLKSYGYSVGTVGSAPTQSYAQTVVVDLSNGKDPYTRRYLELRYHTSAVTSLPDSSIQPDGANFVIILGQDEAVNS